LDMMLLLLPHQTVAFLGSISAITNPLDIQIYVSWYHSIATQCIVLHVKFENGLSISILRNKCFFPKNWISNFQIFKFSIEFRNFSKPAERSTIGRQTQAWGMRPHKSRPKV
jgi:hypothetical protein